MSKRGTYEIRWKPINGKNGGLGPVKSFMTTLSDPKQASKKLRAHGYIVSVRKVR